MGPTPKLAALPPGSRRWTPPEPPGVAYPWESSMPTYEYLCSNCKNQWEEVQKISEPAITVCPKCSKATAHRQISGGNFILKGGGWYADLYSSSKPAKKDEGSGSSESKTTESTGGESKSKESISTAKSEKSESSAPKASSTPSSSSSSGSAGGGDSK